MTTLIIARHGNTFEAGQTPTRVGGRTDLPLVGTGEEQAQLLGTTLKHVQLVPVHVYTSKLQRTIKTAQLAMEAIGAEVMCEQLPFLNEIDYGPDENQPDGKVVERIGKEALLNWDLRGEMPVGWSPSPDTIVAEWRKFLAKIQVDFPQQNVLVVTSNGIARFAGRCTENGQDFPLKLATGAYGVLATTAKGLWRMNEWNTRP